MVSSPSLLIDQLYSFCFVLRGKRKELTDFCNNRMLPGQNMDDYLTILRSGLWRLYYKLSHEGKLRFFSEFFPLLHDTKHQVLGSRDATSYYLVYIGTKPSQRGKGLARKNIEYVTKTADREHRACYLESSNAANPAIYRKYGFETVRAIQLVRAEKVVVLDIMVRER